MNKFIFTLIGLIFLNNCSLNENSKIWKNNENKLEKNKNITKFFSEENKVVKVFNENVKLNLKEIKGRNKIIENHNNFGSQVYKGEFINKAKYKFSKFNEINKLDHKPIFLKDGIIFFNNKGSIIKYDENQKVIWKKNHYSKAEKKLNPKLNFLIDGQNLLITDNIAKYYSVKIDTGEINWSKNNIYPFNSNIKKFKNKMFAVDYKNTLRCFSINDGNECWSLQTDDSFTISNNKYSIITVDNNVIFSNSIGDITAVDVNTGLITWQLPTQSNTIINETYNFKNSSLVSDGNSIFFSNSKNEFYSIDVKTGGINWINEINSIIKPILIGDLIFSVSNKGYLFVIEKNKGNIIRITDLFINYKDKKRNNVTPVGFVIGNNNLYLTNSDGTMIVSELELGNVTKIEKVSGGLLSEPFIFNENLYIVRNGSIIQYN